MFEDRIDAAKKLCPKLLEYKNNKNAVIVGLTRGGVVTAKEISKFLHLNFKAIIIKKITVPGNEELAIGAMVSKEDVFWNKSLCRDFGIDKAKKEDLVSKKEKEIKKLEIKLGIKNTQRDFKEKITIVIDDGIATGASAIAASNFIRKQNPKQTILATPVIAFDALGYIKKYFDNVIYLEKRKDFYAVGQFYKNFEQISDEETANILGK